MFELLWLLLERCSDMPVLGVLKGLTGLWGGKGGGSS